MTPLLSTKALLVNTNKSYAAVGRALARGEDREAAMAALEQITCGDWPTLTSELLDEWANLLLGTYRNVITVAYRVKSYRRLLDEKKVEKVRFIAEPAPEYAFLIGQPQIGGPWQRGEARGTRRVETPFDPDPADQTWTGRVMEVARRYFPDPIRRVRTAHREAGITLDDVEVDIGYDGVVVVDVPVGTSVLVRQSARPVRGSAADAD